MINFYSDIFGNTSDTLGKKKKATDYIIKRLFENKKILQDKSKNFKNEIQKIKGEI